MFINSDFHSNQGNITVIGYTITTKNNVTGIYAIGFSACKIYPLIIGMKPSQISQSELLKLFRAENQCYTTNPLSGNIQGEQGLQSHHLIASTPMNGSQTGEILEAKTDSAIYNYGDIIHLTVDDSNLGSRNEISSFRSEYPGIKPPCGIGYFDYSFLKGDHTNITNFDQLLSAKNDTLNVQYSVPYVSVSGCPGVSVD